MTTKTMVISNPQIALNDSSERPYTVSFKVSIADQSVLRKRHVTLEGAKRFSERHGLSLPVLCDE